jgi:hypothetical protein
MRTLSFYEFLITRICTLTCLSLFNLWISPPSTRQGRIGKILHKYMGQAEVER